MKRTAAYHGIKNVKYSMRTSDNKPGVAIKSSLYSKALTLDPQIDTVPVYADDKTVMTLTSDQGFTGSYNTTGRDADMENDLGFTETLANGAEAELNSIGSKRLDMYYEYIEYTDNQQPFTVKVWLINCELRKPSRAHSSDTNTKTIGEQGYPLTVYGDKLMEDATKTYKDANGNERYATRVISVPGDSGYETFETKVPGLLMEEGI